MDSTLNTAETTGDLQLVRRVRGSLDGKLLRGDIDGRGILAKATYRILAKGRPG